MFRSAFERAGVTLTIDCDPLPEPVYVDRDKWEKIVLNLVSNALKFTFTGAVQVIQRTLADHIQLRGHGQRLWDCAGGSVAGVRALLSRPGAANTHP